MKKVNILDEDFSFYGETETNEELQEPDEEDDLEIEAINFDADDETTSEDTKTDNTDVDETSQPESVEQPVEPQQQSTDGINDSSSEPDIDTMPQHVFGSDNSDVQNQYNEKDVERLNKLIAAESDAINDYLTATKDTHDENLMHLYGDIGAEERFHLEQLMYAKSQLTGEKYEPRDPKVKEEYEELVNNGMDEETALTTIADKHSLSSNIATDEDLFDIESGIEFTESALFEAEYLFNAASNIIDKKEYDDSVYSFMEAYIYQEDMINVASAENKRASKSLNPIELLKKGISALINIVRTFIRSIRDFVSKSRIKTKRKMEWLKNHGIKGIFAKGESLYFYDDRTSRINTNEAVRYIDMLYQMTATVAKNCGIQLKEAAQHNGLKDGIKIGSIEQGINIINNTKMLKSKIVITDKNEQLVMSELFGYSPNKLGVTRTYQSNGQTIEGVHESNNIYNRLSAICEIASNYMEISTSVLNMLEGFEGNRNSVYYTNRKLYDKSVSYMKTICEGYKKIIGCLSHDIKAIMRLDNGILEQTQAQDVNDKITGKPLKQKKRVEPVPGENELVGQAPPKKGLFSRFKK